jgi:hypothetical protein
LRSAAAAGIVAAMISVVAFLCALSVSPADCNRASAIDVITFPEAAAETLCLHDAQATLATLAIHADAGHRWIVKCGRDGAAPYPRP